MIKWAIDVSHYDAGIDINSYKAVDWKLARDQGGLSLAIMKASEGTNFRDPAFALQWKAARGFLPRMAYHFFRCNQNAIQQADFCWDVIREQGFDPRTDFVILDFETIDGKSGADCLKAAGSWLYEMEKHNIIPLIYTYPSFWKGIGGETASWAAKYPLGLAYWPKDIWILSFSPTIFNATRLEALQLEVTKGLIKPAALKPWSSPAIWQFTARADSKAIPGHPGLKKVVDYNAIFMELSNTALPAPLPSTDTPSTPPPSGLGQYSFTGGSLKVFSMPDSNSRQVSTLVNNQLVNVLELVTNLGEQWSRIDSPAGWCRSSYLQYVGASPNSIPPSSGTSPNSSPQPGSSPNPNTPPSTPNPAPSPAPSTGFGLYRFSGYSLKVFEGPASTYRQINMIYNNQTVTVLELLTNAGEVWARIQSPAGWCRLSYLVKV
jgi:Glycosyl hydrolases family 25/Bacterial SH3 domain/GW (Gly-Tryp) dipeptide domain